MISLSLSWHTRLFLLFSPPALLRRRGERAAGGASGSQAGPTPFQLQLSYDWFVKLPSVVGLGLFPEAGQTKGREAVKCCILNKPCTGFTCQGSSKVFNRLLIVQWSSKHADTDCTKSAFPNVRNSHSWHTKKNLKMHTCIWFNPWFYQKTHFFCLNRGLKNLSAFGRKNYNHW